MKVIRLPFSVKKSILACGADMKGAFSLAKKNSAYLFDGFGDLSDADNFLKYEKAIDAAEKKLKIYPDIIVSDMHPGYFSTQFCANYINKNQAKPLIWRKVQHHEAHVASAIIDSNIKSAVLGVAFDGTGYGVDGKIWGGEFFVGKIGKFKRYAHLRYIAMPGGEICIKEPWRMAASYIHMAYAGKKHYKDNRWPVLKRMIDNNINSPETSSMGRLFDAVGSLVLNKKDASFEAELPIALENIADKNENGYYDFDIKKIKDALAIDVSETIRCILKDLDKKVSNSKISAKFHNTIAHVILVVANKSDIKDVVLSGGVFQNKFLVGKTKELLKRGGFKVYTHSIVETSDSGIPLGQIALANEMAF